jgi:uncharacterized protein
MNSQMANRINLITLGVHDLKQSTKFYSDLGFKLAKGSNEHISFFCTNTSLVVSLYEQNNLHKDIYKVDLSKEKIEGHSNCTFAINCQSEEEVGKVYSHVINVGGRIVQKPEKKFWGGFSGYFADFDSHVWEVAFNPFWPLNSNLELTLSPNDGKTNQ